MSRAVGLCREQLGSLYSPDGSLHDSRQSEHRAPFPRSLRGRLAPRMARGLPAIRGSALPFPAVAAVFWCLAMGWHRQACSSASTHAGGAGQHARPVPFDIRTRLATKVKGAWACAWRVAYKLLGGPRGLGAASHGCRPAPPVGRPAAQSLPGPRPACPPPLPALLALLPFPSPPSTGPRKFSSPTPPAPPGHAQTRYAYRRPVPSAPFAHALPDPEGFEPAHLWLLARHGTRWPTQDRMKQIDTLVHLFRVRVVGGAGGDRRCRSQTLDGLILQSTAPNRVHGTMNPRGPARSSTCESAPHACRVGHQTKPNRRPGAPVQGVGVGSHTHEERDVGLGMGVGSYPRRTSGLALEPDRCGRKAWAAGGQGGEVEPPPGHQVENQVKKTRPVHVGR
jgi:hypothetical protein